MGGDQHRQLSLDERVAQSVANALRLTGRPDSSLERSSVPAHAAALAGADVAVDEVSMPATGDRLGSGSI